MTGDVMTSPWLPTHCLGQGERDPSPGEEELEEELDTHV